MRISMNRPDTITKNGLHFLAADVVRLSRLLTRERDGLPAAYLKDEGLRKAYRAYFLPANLSKIHRPLRDLGLHPQNLFSRKKLRVLDIGAGPGTASLGMLDFFSGQEHGPALEFLIVDQVMENLQEAEELFRVRRSTHSREASMRTIHADIAGMERTVQGHFDVVILSNVLNEVFAHDEARTLKRVTLLQRILEKFLADNGSCIIIEPALRETSRELLLVRDGMLDLGLHVYSPCFGRGKCPALVNPKDWCHEDIPWGPPALVQEIDKLIGLRKDSLKFTYLVLRKDGLSLADVCGPDAFRVVSEPLVSKGKVEFYLCRAGERKLVIRQDKDATPGNRVLTDMKRGAVVRFEKLMDEGKRFKVGKDTTVLL